ncbi:amino acid transporter AVT1I-like isoform X2 [Primulina huaijiensis]|uniref:amino acid transporter AVT1I-like isoform X2 n=1 Tax=Primulina huaijiensis TaxID=1492673 RepID=UPI003CC785C1
MKAGVEDGNGAIVVPLLIGNGDEIIDHKDNDHGFVSGSTSFFKTCFNSVNALSGVGILSLPHAVSSGGWLSLIFFFLIAASTYYTALLIQRCLDMDKNIRSYSDIGGRSFGSKGRAIISIATNIELYLVATGVMASFVLIGSVLWAAVFDGIGFHGKGTFVNLKGFPIAVSLHAFCYCAHPVFPALYNSMKDQKKFSKVMLVCFLVITTSYASMAVLGYLMFGSKAESQVTLNLPTSKTSSKVAIYTTLVNPFAKYALMLKPVISALENHLTSSPSRGLSVLIRTGLVLSTIMVAVAIPFFGYLMSLVGAFLSVTASIILPCVCFLKISGIYRRFGFEMVLIWVIVLVGGVILVVGTYTALEEIIEHL